MATPQVVNEEANWLNDPFLSETTDISTLTPEQQKQFRQKFNLPEPARGDDMAGLSPEIIRNPRREYEEMLRDPEVQAEIARTNPTFKESWDLQRVEAAVHQFRKENPRYKAAARNKDAIFRHLTRQYLDGVDWLDSEDAALQLLNAGKLSPQTLKDAYTTLLGQGRLEVPDGEHKELSPQEEIRILALIRTGHFPDAIQQFMKYALVNDRNTYNDVPDFFARNPEVASKAALYVWRNSQADLSEEEFSRFQQEMLAGKQLLTFNFIGEAWNSWRSRNKVRPHLFPMGTQQPVPEPENLEELSDAELDSRINEARRQVVDQARSIRRRGSEL
jgi:hypothetical protein